MLRLLALQVASASRENPAIARRNLRQCRRTAVNAQIQIYAAQNEHGEKKHSVSGNKQTEKRVPLWFNRCSFTARRSYSLLRHIRRRFCVFFHAFASSRKICIPVYFIRFPCLRTLVFRFPPALRLRSPLKARKCARRVPHRYP